jgi:hypothetical protein
LGIAFMLRYRQGRWKKMRVIEDQPMAAPSRMRGTLVMKRESGQGG